MATARTIGRHEMGEFLSVIRLRIRVSLKDPLSYRVGGGEALADGWYGHRTTRTEPFACERVLNDSCWAACLMRSCIGLSAPSSSSNNEDDCYLVYLVCLVYFVERNEPDEPNQPVVSPRQCCPQQSLYRSSGMFLMF